MSGWREALAGFIGFMTGPSLPYRRETVECALLALTPEHRIDLARELLPDGWVAIERKDMPAIVDLERRHRMREVLGNPFEGYSPVAQSSPNFRLWGAALYPRVPEP